jgi:hypothetical protein
MRPFPLAGIVDIGWKQPRHSARSYDAADGIAEACSLPTVEARLQFTFGESFLMINVWFTSDFHFGHRNILRYCNRPFDSIEDMDATLLANLNSKVGENDILYFLGDLCLGGADRARLYRDRIVCRNIHMIEGKSRPGPSRAQGRVLQLESDGGDSSRRATDRSVSLCDAGLASFLPRCLAPLRTFRRQTAGRADLAVHRRGSGST